ncbi:Uu.00g135760.m01.CDS01 [Anthostomella pinea]|uniref:Translation initiation factor IF-2, mitochondrial n=1 Tax=Anthostomella pinea TaxID=933095 RepID=A0AAI8YIJ1_9PEZI|nr:Uu.00g135760.m01.CDS01 [Anthostomella pinea]
MLRRRILNRDTSICAFCRYRQSLRLPTARPRAFSSSPCHKNDDQNRPSWGTPAGAASGASWGSSLPSNNASDEAKIPSRDVPNRSGPVHQDTLLSRHEIAAREALLKKKLAQEAPRSPAPEFVDERVKARYVWNPERQQEIERNLRRENPLRLRDYSGMQREPRTFVPPIQRGSDPGSNTSIRFERARPSDQRPPPREVNSFHRRIVNNPEESPVTLVPSAPGRNERSTSPRQRRGDPALELGHDIVRPRLSNMAQSGSFWSTPPQPTKTSEDSGSARPIPSHAASGWPSDASASRTAESSTSVSRGESERRTPFMNIGTRENRNRFDHSASRGDNVMQPAYGNDSWSPRTRNQRDTIPGGSKSRDRGLSDNNFYHTPSNDRFSRSPTRDVDSTAETPTPWRQLARKQTQEKSNKGDFWAAFGSNNGRDAEGRKSRSQVSGKTAKGSLDSKIVGREDPKPNPSDDWGKEFDQRIEYRKMNRQQPAASEAKSETKEVPLPQSDYESQSRSQKPKGRDRDRDRRLERFEREERTDKARGKRSKRQSRFGDADEDEEVVSSFDRYQERRRQKAERKAQRDSEQTEPRPILLPELISITALADALKIRPDEFLVQLGELGFEGVTLDSLMAGETAALVAQEYGYEPTVRSGEGDDLKPRPPPVDPSVLPERPPVVTIMGHVDHGKTTLLDYLRKSSVAAQEHGGITQHIGAFSVKLSSGKPITFLDTPGHAAFLTMRQRGANVTDIVVLVVAADDSVKPQTIEALKHARASKVPIIVAINKIDKDGARIDLVKHDLAENGVEIEDFGGDVQVVCVSGKTGEGMADLEENILTLSEILDHRAEVDGPAEGWILESSLKTTGKAATVLVKRGTLRPGDYIAAGLTWAKIRHLRNEAGVDVDEAPPGSPVEILGWKDLPAAGDAVIQAPDEGKAKSAVTYREGLREREKDAADYEVIGEARKALQEKRAREKAAAEGAEDPTAAEELADEEDGTKLVNFVVKGDVHGSVEAVCAAILEIGSHEVRPRILRSAAGPISEFDVEHAATSKSTIINFATTTPGYIKRMAEEQGVRILDHTIIYHLVDEVKAKLSEYLTPDVTSRVLGEAEVLQIFPINVRGRVYKNVAGCRVRNGVVARNSLYRVFRKGEKLYDGKLETLKHIKKNVEEMRKGAECGIGFEDFQDLEIGDQIQAYDEVKTARTL